jgi:hypothetical protein
MKWDELLDFGWLCPYCKRVFKEAFATIGTKLMRVGPYDCPSCGRADLEAVAIYNGPRQSVLR